MTAASQSFESKSCGAHCVRACIFVPASAWSAAAACAAASSSVNCCITSWASCGTNIVVLKWVRRAPHSDRLQYASLSADLPVVDMRLSAGALLGSYLQLGSLSGQCLLRKVLLLLQLLCEAVAGTSHCCGLVSSMLLLQLPPELSCYCMGSCTLCIQGLAQPLSLLFRLCKLALQLLALLLRLSPPSNAIQPSSGSLSQVPADALCDDIFTVQICFLCCRRQQANWERLPIPQPCTMDQLGSLMASSLTLRPHTFHRLPGQWRKPASGTLPGLPVLLQPS